MDKKTITIIFLLMPLFGFSAENISTGGSTGKDYSTLAGWFAAVEGDITAGNAEVLECYDTGGNIAGGASGTWTTDSDSYVSIRAASGEETDGVSSGATISGQYITNLTSGCDNFRMKKMRLLSSGADDMIDFITVTGTDILFERNVFDGAGNVTLQYSCIDVNAAATFIVRNCVFTAQGDTTNTDQGHGIHLNTSATVTIDNCTFVGWDDGIENDGGTITCQNIITVKCTDGFDGTITKTTCYSDIASDANSQTTQYMAQLFTDPGNGDYSVKDNSSDLYDNGTDLSGSFTDDIIGYTRSQWDVGAFELQEAAAAATPGARKKIRPRYWGYLLEQILVAR